VIALLTAVLVGCGDRPPAAPQVSIVETQSGVPRTLRGDVPFIVGYDAGYRRAMSTGQPTLVFFTAEWCTYCQQMAESGF
jgi:thiol-disulfide isomerase/thioredoxin